VQSTRVPNPDGKAHPHVGARARVTDQSATTQGDRRRGSEPAVDGDQTTGDDPARLFSWREVLINMGGYFTPPVVWSRAAPSLSELASYARTGEWTGPDGFWRTAGLGWWRLVGLPVTCVCRYTEWIVQRPGRFLTVLWVYGLLAHTDFAGWLLPWPSWLP
jgi:hypothetical protein